jgi:hypothetical protein
MLALALPLTACGGVSLNAVAKAADNATAAGTEHVAFTGTVTAAGQTIDMTGTGDFQTSPRLGAMHIAMQAAGQQIVMDEVSKGWTVYLKSPLFSAQLPAGKHWLSIDVKKASSKLGVNLSQYTQQDPTDALAALKRAGAVDKVGSEQIDGVDTTHYRATIDLSKAAKSLPQGTSLKSLPVDVWIDGDNQLRRMVLNYSATVSGQAASTKMQMDFSNFGEQLNVQAPSASDTVDMTSLGG